MKRIDTLSFLLLATTSLLTPHIITAITPYYPIRSQGVNAPRRVVGTLSTLYTPITTRIAQDDDITRPINSQDQIESTESTGLFGALSGYIQPESQEKKYIVTTSEFLNATFEYTRSFDHEKINRCLFGDSLKNCDGIKISGSKAPNRGEKDWLADYFYLPNDFESTIRFQPTIDNFIVDFNFYIDLDRWIKNSYVALYAPLAHTRWNLNMRESVKKRGVEAHVAGLFTPQTMYRGSMQEDFTAFACGTELKPIKATAPSNPITSDFIEYTVLQQLKNAQISCGEKSTTRFADVRAHFGWNIPKESYHVGFTGEVAMPAGTRPRGEYLFEPVVGNGNHWEIGVGMNSHYNLWSNEDASAAVTLYSEAHITHLVSTRHMRTFDLCGKPFSRYMLTQKMGTPVTNNVKGGGTSATSQFKQEFAPLANFSTICVDVSVAVQADVLVMANARWKNWSFDAGYNLWGRTCEKIKEQGFNILDKNSTWALKGDAQMFGFATAASMNANNINNITLDQPVALSATQSNATIYSGLNGASPTTNPNIDNPKLATAHSGPSNMQGPPVNLSSVIPATNPPLINTSIQPVFIKETDLNLCGASTAGLSSTIFAHLNYTGQERSTWTPHVGIGGQAEFGHTSASCENKSDCQRCSLSQWGAWIKIGVSFE